MTPMNPMDIDYESILDNRILRAQCLFSDVMVIPRCMKCGSFEMVIDATQATREGVMCLNHCGMNPDMPVITKKVMLPYMAKIKYFCKNCGAHMETTTSTIPEGYLQWNKAWRDEKTCEERQAYAERLRAEEEKRQAIEREFREALFMHEALRTETTLHLTREELLLRVGLIHVFVPRKQRPNWRFRRKWKR